MILDVLKVRPTSRSSTFSGDARCGLGREGPSKGRAAIRAAFGAEPARRLLPLNHWCPRSARARVAYSCIAWDDRFKAPTASRHELQTCTRARTCGVSV